MVVQIPAKIQQVDAMAEEVKIERDQNYVTLSLHRPEKRTQSIAQ
jgi:hypothetical protein